MPRQGCTRICGCIDYRNVTRTGYSDWVTERFCQRHRASAEAEAQQDWNATWVGIGDGAQPVEERTRKRGQIQTIRDVR